VQLRPKSALLFIMAALVSAGPAFIAPLPQRPAPPRSGISGDARREQRPAEGASLGGLALTGAVLAGAGNSRRSKRGKLCAVKASPCFFEMRGNSMCFPSEDGKQFEMDTSVILGVGAQGKVHPGKNLATGEVVAIKSMPVKHLILDETGAAKIQLIHDEIATMKAVGQHPNIAGMVAGVDVFRQGTSDHPHFINLVLELVEGKELAEHIAAHGPLQESVAHHVFTEILAGLKHLKSCGVVHRDLKCENILVTGEKISKDSRVKLIDFGVASQAGENAFKTLVGTLEIMPPEMAKAKINYLPDSSARNLHTAKFKPPSQENPGFGFTQLTQDGYGARLINVDPNGPAGRQGVKNDWILTKINDINVEKMLFQMNADDSSHAKVPKIVNTLMELTIDFTLEMVEMPERNFSAKVDTWAVGVVLFTCLTGKAPFTSEVDIIESDYNKALLNCSEEAKSLLAGLLEKDPEKRLSLEQCLAHPWLLRVPA